jgi:hypothetical protein
MCTPASYSFSLYKGDDYSLIFTIDGDRTGDTPTVNLRTSFEAASPSLTITTPAITQVYNSTTGKTLVTVPFTDTQTAALTSTSYVWDFTYVQAGGLVWTPLAGRLSVTKGV